MNDYSINKDVDELVQKLEKWDVDVTVIDNNVSTHDINDILHESCVEVQRLMYKLRKIYLQTAANVSKHNRTKMYKNIEILRDVNFEFENGVKIGGWCLRIIGETDEQWKTRAKDQFNQQKQQFTDSLKQIKR